MSCTHFYSCGTKISSHKLIPLHTPRWLTVDTSATTSPAQSSLQLGDGRVAIGCTCLKTCYLLSSLQTAVTVVLLLVSYGYRFVLHVRIGYHVSCPIFKFCMQHWIQKDARRIYRPGTRLGMGPKLGDWKALMWPLAPPRLSMPSIMDPCIPHWSTRSTLSIVPGTPIFSTHGCLGMRLSNSHT